MKIITMDAIAALTRASPALAQQEHPMPPRIQALRISTSAWQATIRMGRAAHRR
jgi:hypothetical protein